MRNRAKCKLCHSLLESFHRYDYVSCKCGEISISGGLETFECAAKNWDHFVRIDDEEREVPVKIQEDPSPQEESTLPPVTKKDLLDMIEAMIEYGNKIPPTAPVTNSDLNAFMTCVLQVLRKEN